MALDGIKTGMTVSREILRLDSKQFQKRPPKWKESDEEKIRYETTNELHPRRPPTLGKFIMDDLYKHAEIKTTFGIVKAYATIDGGQYWLHTSLNTIPHIVFSSN